MAGAEALVVSRIVPPAVLGTRLANRRLVHDREIPGYVDEEGATPERGIETFVEVVVELDS